MSSMNLPRIIRLPDVINRTGWSKSTIYNRISDGLFPKPISLGARAIGFVETEIDEFLKALIAGLPDEQLKEFVRGLETRRFQAFKGIR